MSADNHETLANFRTLGAPSQAKGALLGLFCPHTYLFFCFSLIETHGSELSLGCACVSLTPRVTQTERAPSLPPALFPPLFLFIILPGPAPISAVDGVHALDISYKRERFTSETATKTAIKCVRVCLCCAFAQSVRALFTVYLPADVCWCVRCRLPPIIR